MVDPVKISLSNEKYSRSHIVWAYVVPNIGAQRYGRVYNPIQKRAFLHMRFYYDEFGNPGSNRVDANRGPVNFGDANWPRLLGMGRGMAI